MYKGLNEMNMEELICTDGGGVGWLAERFKYRDNIGSSGGHF